MALDLECSLLSRRRVRGRTSEHVKIGRTKSRNLFVHYGLLVILYSCVLLFMWTVTRLLNNAFPIFRNQNVPEVDEYTSYGRHLLRVRPNCTPRSVDEFPADFMSDEQRNKGGIVVHIFIACYMFVSLAYVCEVYFVPSLEILCKLVGLQHDVAGATLMALGTSAPEFATSVIGVFITDTDIGLGTVVGSLVFNLFMIIACCCFFAGREVPLHWWPLCRDCIVYLIGILGLVLVMFDNICRWWEGLILFSGYFGYIILLYFNPRLSLRAQAWSQRRRLRKKHKNDPPLLKNGAPNYGAITENGDDTQTKTTAHVHLDVKTVIPNQNDDTRIDADTSFDDRIEDSGIGNNGSSSSSDDKGTHKYEDPVHMDNIDYADVDTLAKYEHSRSPIYPPKHPFRFALWILGLPVVLLMFISIPDSRKKRFHWFFPLTFIMATIWIALLAYLMVWMVAIVGHTFGIPDSAMGITFLAAGTSIPDAMASTLVAMDGLGDMAISNIIGSNIFEIYICLGGLWFIRSITDDLDPVDIYSSGLTFTSMMLFGTVVFAFGTIHLNGWKLDKKMGVICTLCYAVVISFAIMYELNVFADVNPPPCKY